MGIVYPPEQAFASQRVSLEKSQGGYHTDNWVRTELPPSGGMFAWYSEHPYPRKGHTYPEVCEANNIVKKVTVGSIMSIASPYSVLAVGGFLITPWKYKIKWMEKALSNYVRMADYANRLHYLKKERYCKASQELWDLVFQTLRNLGISFDVAYRCGRIAAHLIEHDDAYRYRVQDIFSEMSKPHMMANPSAEILRVIGLYLKREGSGISEKFTAVAKILSLGLKVPKVKKAYLEAIRQANIENLRLDEADQYFCRQRDDYDFMGEDRELRVKKFIQEYNQYQLKRFKDMVTESVKNPEALEKLNQQLNAFGV
jgi:hypothetical protein